MTELKPCPFCGGTAAIHRGSVYQSTGARVHCSRCHVSTQTITEGVYLRYQGEHNRRFTPDQAEAIRKWNTRTESEPRTNNENVKGW